jgi:hypothetical protein
VFTASSTTPTPGNWEGISLWNEGSATITYATLSYGGSGNGDIAITSDTNMLDIQNSKLEHSSTYGIGIPWDSGATVTNTNNTFTDNTSGDVGPGNTCH